MRPSLRSTVAITVIGITSAACVTSETTPSAATVTASVAPSPPGTGGAPSQAADPEGMITTIQQLPEATIQIVASGSFADPIFGEIEGGGKGSGFIIDSSGIAVTNSHVVTGAGLVEAYVGGDPEPINAEVLGVSECNDLAVIDLAGDGYSYLGWQEEPVSPGLDVIAAGYPLGDPQFTVTAGVISKSDFASDTPWASVGAILEHDARIRAGNSGGPLVTEESMRVVGVNYATREDTDQNYAISATEAVGIVERLASGTDVDSIGINGVAAFAGGTPGVWVQSVQAGSAADAAGVTAGDLILRIGGLSVAGDGTVGELCDVIRTKGPDAVIPIEVHRQSTGRVLRGQINGEPMAQAFSFAAELREVATVEQTAATYESFNTITDDGGAIQVEVPTEWSDVSGEPYADSQDRQVTDVRAAPDLDAFLADWATPGMAFSASSAWAATTTEEDLLDALQSRFGDCTYAGRTTYQDPAYTGFFDTFTSCGDIAATYVVLAARPTEGDFLILVQAQANEERDLEALDRIMSSFTVLGTV